MAERIFSFIKNLTASLFTLLKVLIRSNYFPKKHQPKTDDLYILGNGPSLKEVLGTNIDFLSKKPLLCVNKFPDTKHFTILKPAYFIICSPGFWSTSAIDYNVSVRAKIIESLVQKTNWPLTCLLPYDSKHNKSFTSKIRSNPNITIHYYNTTPLEGLDNISLLLMRLNWATPRPHNVLVPAIHFALSSKFKNTYILGADHSWLTQLSVNQENEVLINQKHFYDENTSTAKQMHKQDGHAQRKLHEVLEKFYFSFRSYHLLNKFAGYQNVKIFNLTPNSFIDAFPKKTIDTLK